MDLKGFECEKVGGLKIRKKALSVGCVKRCDGLSTYWSLKIACCTESHNRVRELILMEKCNRQISTGC